MTVRTPLEVSSDMQAPYAPPQADIVTPRPSDRKHWLLRAFLSLVICVAHLLMVIGFLWLSTGPVLPALGMTEFSRFMIYYGFTGILALLAFDVVMWFVLRDRWKWFLVCTLAIPTITLLTWLVLGPSLRNTYAFYSLPVNNERKDSTAFPSGPVGLQGLLRNERSTPQTFAERKATSVAMPT